MKRVLTAILLTTVLAGIPVFATALNRTERKAGLTLALASSAAASSQNRRLRLRRLRHRRLRNRRRHAIAQKVIPGDHNWIHNPTRSALRRGRRRN